MAAGIRKFNPGFLTDDEIVASFCVRNAEFKSLLESLHASTANSNVHTLVIGPRGQRQDASTAEGSRGDPTGTNPIGILPRRVR